LAAVVIGMPAFFDVESAQASIATDTAEALASNPDGGQCLELAAAESRAVVAPVLAVRHPKLSRTFEVAGGCQPPHLSIPTGGAGGGFDAANPN